MSSVKEETMYRAADGTLYSDKGLAEHYNGMLALRIELESVGPVFTVDDVLKSFQDWYVIYLEGKK